MRILTLALCGGLVACGGDDGGITAQGDCELDIVVSGGYAWKSAATTGTELGCGSTGPKGTDISVDSYGPGDGVVRSVAVMFGAPYTTRGPLSAGEVGTFDVMVSVEVEGETSPGSQWRSEVDGCSFKIVKNELTPDDFFANKYVIGGTVTCSADLLSFDDLSGGLDPISVNAFKFQTFESYTP